jgi:hypothetical protein
MAATLLQKLGEAQGSKLAEMELPIDINYSKLSGRAVFPQEGAPSSHIGGFALCHNVGFSKLGFKMWS